MTTQELKNKFSAMFSWQQIDKKDYASYGIANFPEAKVIASYKIGVLYRSFNTMTLYDYGKNENFIDDLKFSYEELQMDIEEQEEYGVFPLHWENFGDNKFFSVLRLVHNPIMNIIDLFFIVDNNVYCFHTYLPKEEKSLKLDELTKRYKDIQHVVKEINAIKN